MLIFFTNMPVQYNVFFSLLASGVKHGFLEMSPDWAGCERTAGASVLMTAPSTEHRSWMCFKRRPPGDHIPPRNSHLPSYQQFGLQRHLIHLPESGLWLWAKRWHEDVFSNVYANNKSERSITAVWPRWKGRWHQRSGSWNHMIREWLEKTQRLSEKHLSITPCSATFPYARAKCSTSKVFRPLGAFRMTGFSSKVVKACTKTGGWKPHHGLHCRNHRWMENTNRWMKTTLWSLLQV